MYYVRALVNLPTHYPTLYITNDAHAHSKFYQDSEGRKVSVIVYALPLFVHFEMSEQSDRSLHFLILFPYRFTLLETTRS